MGESSDVTCQGNVPLIKRHLDPENACMRHYDESPECGPARQSEHGSKCVPKVACYRPQEDTDRGTPTPPPPLSNGVGAPHQCPRVALRKNEVDVPPMSLAITFFYNAVAANEGGCIRSGVYPGQPKARN